MAQPITRSITNEIIAYSFTGGVLVALVLGLISQVIPESITPYLTSLLILAGIVVGFFNITPEEAKDYVVYVTALVIVTTLSQGSLSSIQYVGTYLEAILSSILAFIVPSVIIVAVRSIVHLARD
jgi:uncharacterized membrane protein